MTYSIRMDGRRWLILAEGACVLACEDYLTALQTAAEAAALLHRAPHPRHDQAIDRAEEKRTSDGNRKPWPALHPDGRGGSSQEYRHA
jgi:hypothetical protein